MPNFATAGRAVSEEIAAHAKATLNYYIDDTIVSLFFRTDFDRSLFVGPHLLLFN